MSDNLSQFVETECLQNVENEEIKTLCEVVNFEKRKYRKNKLLVDIALEVARDDNSNMPDNLKTVIKRIILSSFPGFKADYLLGLSDLTKLALTHEENIVLQQVIEQKLNEKSENISHQFLRITGENIDTSINVHIQHQHKIVELEQKLNKEKDAYVHNLKTLIQLLENMLKWRIETMPDITNKKLEEFQIRAKLHELQSKICMLKTRVSTFNETETSLYAYKELIGDLDEQYKEYILELTNLRRLKEEYDSVSSKEYQCILKSYLDYKHILEKKQCVYEQVTSTRNEK